jgi:hypothetical protein
MQQYLRLRISKSKLAENEFDYRFKTSRVLWVKLRAFLALPVKRDTGKEQRNLSTIDEFLKPT